MSHILFQSLEHDQMLEQAVNEALVSLDSDMNLKDLYRFEQSIAY